MKRRNEAPRSSPRRAPGGSVQERAGDGLEHEFRRAFPYVEMHAIEVDDVVARLGYAKGVARVIARSGARG